MLSATAGTGLRNRQAAAVNLSGVIAPVQTAFLSWGVIVPTPTDPPSVKKLFLRQASPVTTSKELWVRWCYVVIRCRSRQPGLAL